MKILCQLPHQDRDDTTSFLALLERMAQSELKVTDNAEWHVSRAPGRMDVMGGIADYSGSLVLQAPISEACHAAITIQAAAPQEGRLRIVSHTDGGRSSSFATLLSDLFPRNQRKGISYEAAQSYFKNDSEPWAAYVAGCLLVLSKEEPEVFLFSREVDINIVISSDVPEGKGVSSSASIEVSTMMALCSAYGLVLDGCRLATLCQMVENRVVGAACGIMDQMASALGEEGKLLALLCQPATVQETLSIPSDIAFFGIDSGIRHSVGGSDYGSVRVGAFIGLKLVSEEASKQIPYLVKIAPSEWAAKYEPSLPVEISGTDFLDRHEHLDSVTSVDRSKTYSVRVPATHPVQENFRVQTFQELLKEGGRASKDRLEVLGELMYQSHESYNRCKLGSTGTDRLVEMAREAAGRGEPVYGAKITGGGSGGTVCFLVSGDRGREVVEEIAQRYGEEMALKPKIFAGSSPGAVAFGSFRVQI